MTKNHRAIELPRIKTQPLTLALIPKNNTNPPVAVVIQIREPINRGIRCGIGASEGVTPSDRVLIKPDIEHVIVNDCNQAQRATYYKYKNMHPDIETVHNI